MKDLNPIAIDIKDINFAKVLCSSSNSSEGSVINKTLNLIDRKELLDNLSVNTDGVSELKEWINEKI